MTVSGMQVLSAGGWNFIGEGRKSERQNLERAGRAKRRQRFGFVYWQEIQSVSRYACHRTPNSEGLCGLVKHADRG